MGAYKYLQELWRKKQSDTLRFLLRIRAWEYRRLPRVHRCPRSTRTDKAHALGYKRKQGYVIFRSRVRRGDRKRKARKGQIYGKPKHHGIIKQKSSRSLRCLAEQRVGKVAPNLRVLNSYWVNQDSVYKWYEVIAIDPFHNAIRNDPRVNWIALGTHKHRELRGLTSAGKKSRGLTVKGRGHSKLRPSKRANWKRRNTILLPRYR
eukprot:TRINITY_DN565_c0_g1_i2.p1 TRINITY_DN565_c0_g1~~TRINITY_DN565_c0_g1_i2.p1  ORF type:complete len:205 (+),score=22.45 TRINITY_DN565_c0_g1_i2:87-701(+)